eukprot:109235-Rhodomonas_salina.1
MVDPPLPPPTPDHTSPPSDSWSTHGVRKALNALTWSQKGILRALTWCQQGTDMQCGAIGGRLALVRAAEQWVVAAGLSRHCAGA